MFIHLINKLISDSESTRGQVEERSQPQKPFVITFNKPEIDGRGRFVLIEVEENAVLAITRVTTVQAVTRPLTKTTST